MDAGKKKYDKPPHPRATCNVLSALTFSWTLGLFREGRKRDLEVTDLYEPLKEHTSSYLGNKLERYWNDELVQAQKRGRDPSFLRALIRCFGLKMASYGLVLAFMECVLRLFVSVRPHWVRPQWVKWSTCCPMTSTGLTPHSFSSTISGWGPSSL
uniref:Probable multidrug resistance-associated protein lethal(2)03659 n=1 Tax=Cacopsylla melanoneura TaxID=428564 RepID=A0A8D8LQL3_9HEMI